MVAGCQPGTKPSQSQAEIRSEPAPAESYMVQQHRLITQDADRILLALSTRNYQDLPQLCRTANGDIPGSYIAARIIGPYVNTAVLDHWDAQQMVVEFDPALTKAVVKLVLTYRITPNHKPAQTDLLLSFIRETTDQSWSLVIP